MAQNVSRGLIRPFLQSEEKIFSDRKKSGISDFPCIKYFINVILKINGYLHFRNMDTIRKWRITQISWVSATLLDETENPRKNEKNF